MLDLAYSDRLARQLDGSLAPRRVALLKAKYDFLLDHGFLAAPFDFEAFIDPAPLSAAKADFPVRAVLSEPLA